MENTETPCSGDGLSRAALDALAAEIVARAGQISAHICRWLLLVADFDAAGAASVFGLASTSQWLAHACGIAARTASEHVRVARALRAFPALAEEMGAGRLSYSQVRAISRVPRPGEFRVVDDLVEVARHGTAAQLEVVVRGLRTVDHNERGLEQAEREYLTQCWTAESLWRLSARLDPERGAVVKAAIERVAASEQLGQTDALVRLAEIGLAALADAANPPRSLRGDERAAVVIHLDASRLAIAPDQSAAAEVAPGEAESAAARSAEPGDESARKADARDEAEGPGVVQARRSAKPRTPYARIAHGPGLPDRVVKRLLCSGRIRTIVHDGAGNVLDVGRSHRLVTERQFRALLLRHNGHCAHPGCPNTKNLHAHHVLFWFLGGLTDLDNLVLLCERHHVGLHDGDFRIGALGNGRFRFERHHGRETTRPRADTRNANEPGDDFDATNIAPDAATPRWDGQRLDREYAISVLAARRYIEARR